MKLPEEVLDKVRTIAEEHKAPKIKCAKCNKEFYKLGDTKPSWFNKDGLIKNCMIHGE